MSNRGGRRGRVVVREDKSGVSVSRTAGNVDVQIEEGRVVLQVRWTLREARAVANLLTDALAGDVAEDVDKVEIVQTGSGLFVPK